MCAFEWHQGQWPWMTLNCYKFKFSRKIALLRIFGRQQRQNIVRDGIVAHWKFFSTKIQWAKMTTSTSIHVREQMFAVDGVTVKNASEGWFSELCPIYQGSRALTFALASLPCYFWVYVMQLCSIVIIIAGRSSVLLLLWCYCSDVNKYYLTWLD